jgi:5-methylcytosine-specific restriction endonuclease McrA
MYLVKATRKSYHLIKENNPHIQSYASYILLKNDLFRKDVRYNYPQWRLWLTFRNRYLKRQRRINGVLECKYCGESPLEANTNNPRKRYVDATIDHIVPRSKGGREYNEDNLCVCCIKCNSKKADMSLEDFVKRDKGNE